MPYRRKELSGARLPDTFRDSEGRHKRINQSYAHARVVGARPRSRRPAVAVMAFELAIIQPADGGNFPPACDYEQINAASSKILSRAVADSVMSRWLWLFSPASRTMEEILAGLAWQAPRLWRCSTGHVLLVRTQFLIMYSSWQGRCSPIIWVKIQATPTTGSV